MLFITTSTSYRGTLMETIVVPLLWYLYMLIDMLFSVYSTMMPEVHILLGGNATILLPWRLFYILEVMMTCVTTYSDILLLESDIDDNMWRLSLLLCVVMQYSWNEMQYFKYIHMHSIHYEVCLEGLLEGLCWRRGCRSWCCEERDLLSPACVGGLCGKRTFCMTVCYELAGK